MRLINKFTGFGSNFMIIYKHGTQDSLTIYALAIILFNFREARRYDTITVDKNHALTYRCHRT